jgi:hypothetical protein
VPATRLNITCSITALPFGFDRLTERPYRALALTQDENGLVPDIRFRITVFALSGLSVVLMVVALFMR